MKKRNLALAGILGLAFLLRVVGIQFGLPHLYHADEPIVVNHALAYGMGDLNPHYFKFPPLVTYLLFFCYGVYFLIVRGLGVISGVEDFQNLFFSDPSSFYLLGRLVFGAGVGTFHIFLLYHLIRRFFGSWHALASAFVLAVNFLHVRDSHYLYLDVPLLTFLMTAFFPIFSLLEEAKAKHYCLFGILLGLAVGTKYNGFFILAPFLVAHVLSSGLNFKTFFRPAIFATAFLSLFVFLITNPYAVLDSPAFFRDLFSMNQFEGYLGWTHHLTYSLRGALGLALLLLALFGAARGVFRFERKRFVLISFVVVYYVVLVHFSQPHARYILPLVPFTIFLAVDALHFFLFRQRYFYFLGVLGILLIAAPSFAKSVLCDRLLLAEDIRTIALRWTEENIPSGTKLALDSSFFMPRLKPTLEQLQDKRQEAQTKGQQANVRRLDWMVHRAQEGDGRRYELYFLNKASDTEFLFAKPVLPYDVNALIEKGIEYVFVVRLREGHREDFYTALEKSAAHVKRFTSYRDPSRKWPLSSRSLTGAPFLGSELLARERNGQIIDLYKLR